MIVGRHEQSDMRRVGVLGLGILLAAIPALLLSEALPPPPRATLEVSWMALLALFIVADLFVIHLEFRGDVQSFSLSELPLVVGLFTLAPLELVLLSLVANVVALFLRPQVWYKAAFNLVLTAGSAAFAAAVFHLLAAVPVAHPGPRGWFAAWVAVALTSVLDGALIASAVRLSGGVAELRDLRRMWILGLIGTSATTGLALIAITLGEVYPVAGALVVILVTGILYVTSSGYARISERYDKLDQLFGLTQMASRAPDFGRAVDGILTEAQKLLRATRAELVWSTPCEGLQRYAKVGPAPPQQTPAALDPLLRRQLDRGRAVVLPRGSSDEDDWLARHGVRDLLAVPLRQGDVVVGTLTVLDRLGDVVTFDAEDAKVLATFGHHATMALENALLLDELRREAEDKRHQARHDRLTGLPNRMWLYERLAEAISAAASTHHRAAVLLMDIDRFKEINDTLGHHHGDLLLQQVAERLRAALDPEVLLTRLGGDEFALLVPVLSSGAEALAAAEQVQTALEAPFDVDGLSLSVSVSIGVAISPEHGDRAEDLLQRADVAMYAAKRTDAAAVHLYEPVQDRHSARRLAMAGALREAIAANAVGLAFQPKADLATGEVIGVEALARWHDPNFGDVPPDEFIPLAEHVGLIRPLTRQVLTKALRQQRAWELAGYPLSVAVNLSARSLSDTGLADEVAALLAEKGARADRVVLEITESDIMRDPERALLTLQRLRDLGLDLSIDDFGTGHSSLAYLKHLPVDEVKVDRSFVTDVAVDDVDASIVRAIVEVARHRGLRVVAEGVEDATVWRALLRLGCDAAQGYHLARPLSADELTAWLQDRVLAEHALRPRVA